MSATSVGQIGLDLVVNQNQFKKQMTGIQSLAKKTGAALAGAFAIGKLIQFGKECIELGSDLEEVQNVVDVTFPKMSQRVNEFSQNAAASFGLSETMAKRYTGTFGAMSKAFGFSEKAAYDMSTTLTGLAGDVASFYNITQDEAYTKLKSVFTGETESLKDLGVVMTQTALDQYALANGFGKTTQAMSEAEKVALRYAFVQNQLSLASGDFARTSNSWANQVRILKLQMESLMGTIGQGFINLLTPVIQVINKIISKIISLANAFKALTELLTGKRGSSGKNAVSSAGDTATESLDNATKSADNLASSTGAVGKAAENTAKKMRQLMGFDQINKLSDTSGSSGSGGNGGGASGDSFDFADDLSAGGTVVDELNESFVKWFETMQKYTQPTIDALKRLWNEGLSELGDFAWDALQGFYEKFLVPVGKWTLGEGLPRLIDGLNELLTGINWEKIKENLDAFWEALEPFTINIGEGLLWFYEEVLVPLGKWLANEIVTRFLEQMTNLLDLLNSTIKIAEPLLSWLWEKFLKPLSEFVADRFLETMDDAIADLEFFADIAEDLSKIKEIGLVATFKGILETSFTRAKETYEGLKDSKIVKTITGKILEAFTNAKKKWEELKNKTVVKTLSAKLTDKFTKFKKTWDSLKDKTLKVKANVSAAITNIKKLINDKIIAKLNGAINILNKLPGVNVPKIPKLAQGGFVKRNTPQLAVIGDNTKYGEIVAPENKLAEMAKQAAAMTSGGNNAEIISLLRQILLLLQTMDLVATVEGNSIKQLVVRLINDHTKATGMCEINI